MTAVPARQAMSRFTAGDHVCVAFDGSDELLEAVAENARCALDNGEKAVCYTDQFLPIAVEATLETYDTRLRAGLDSGQVVVTGAQDSTLTYARFDPDLAMAAWRDEIRAARGAGYAGMRVITDMSWAANDIEPVPATERLARYEAELNRITASGFVTALCMYDRSLFTQSQLNIYAPAHLGTTRGDGHEPPQLRITHTFAPRGVRLSGEADIATRRAVDAVLAGIADDLPGSAPLVIDLSELTFVDVGTTTALVRAAGRHPGARFTGARRIVGQLLTMIAEFEGVPLVLEGGQA